MSLEQEIEVFKKVSEIAKQISNKYMYNQKYNNGKNILNNLEIASIFKEQLNIFNIEVIVVKGYAFCDKEAPIIYNKVKIGNNWYNVVLHKDIIGLRYERLPFLFLVSDEVIEEYIDVEYNENGVDNFCSSYISKYNIEDVITLEKYKEIIMSYTEYELNNIHKANEILKMKDRLTKKELKLYKKQIDNKEYFKYTEEYLEDSIVLSITEFLEKEDLELEKLEYATLSIGYYNDEEFAEELLKDKNNFNKFVKYRDKIFDCVFKFKDITTLMLEIYEALEYDNKGRKLHLAIYFENIGISEMNIKSFKKSYNKILEIVENIKRESIDILHKNNFKNYFNLTTKEFEYIKNLMGTDEELLKYIYIIKILKFFVFNTYYDFSLADFGNDLIRLKYGEKNVPEIFLKNTTFSKYRQKKNGITNLCSGNLVCAGYSSILIALCLFLGIDAKPVYYKSSRVISGHVWVKVNINNNWYNIDISEDITNMYKSRKLKCILKSDYTYEKITKRNKEFNKEKNLDILNIICTKDFDEEILNKCFYAEINVIKNPNIKIGKIENIIKKSEKIYYQSILDILERLGNV